MSWMVLFTGQSSILQSWKDIKCEILVDSSTSDRTVLNLLVASVWGISLSCSSLKAGHWPFWVLLEHIGEFLSPMNNILIWLNTIMYFTYNIFIRSNIAAHFTHNILTLSNTGRYLGKDFSAVAASSSWDPRNSMAMKGVYSSLVPSK